MHSLKILKIVQEWVVLSQFSETAKAREIHSPSCFTNVGLGGPGAISGRLQKPLSQSTWQILGSIRPWGQLGHSPRLINLGEWCKVAFLSDRMVLGLS